MKIETAKISVKGKLVAVPSIDIGESKFVVTGKWLKVATIQDEEWLEEQPVKDPNTFIAALKQAPLKPDLFTFSQRLAETKPEYPFHLEADNAAAIPITTFAEWWEKRLPQVSRKNVRRAGRRGVIVELAPFNDKLVQGIWQLYNETPIRQGRRFWHYGKDFETVKRDNSSYLDRSDFVVAYCQGEMIGFIKIVYVGKVARMMQILSMNKHFDKRPANALIAKAVEICCQKGCSHLVYGKYIYGNKANSPVTEFKRRNGFEQLSVPAYYVPLTFKGRLALALKLHLGLRKMIPEKLMTFLLNTRSKLYERITLRDSSAGKEALGEAL
jgi:hypothetical protein